MQATRILNIPHLFRNRNGPRQDLKRGYLRIAGEILYTGFLNGIRKHDYYTAVEHTVITPFTGGADILRPENYMCTHK